MSQAPTPAPHTFVLYLLSGGSAFFSVRCQEELIKASMNPDWCGSYSYVADLNKNARQKCAAWDEAAAAGRPGRGPNGDALPQPTPADRYLSQCQSGHLLRDSNFRESGKGARDNPCRTIVPGFETDNAPCVPQQGQAKVKGTEHNAHTLLENQASAAQRAQNESGGTIPPKGDPRNPGGPYPPDTRRADEDARTQPMLDKHKADYPKLSQDTTPGGPVGAGASAGAAGGPVAGSAAAVDAKDPAKPNCPPELEVDGSTAAECINNWRKKAEQAMYDNAKANAAKNAAAAEPSLGGPPPTRATHMAALQQNVAGAQTAVAAAQTPQEKLEAKAALKDAKTELSKYDRDCCRADASAALVANPNLPNETNGHAM